ncbi:MAG TPA: amidase [Roseiarcus sp.]|nr:amidase [Roseiarcus sp.]
MAQSEWTYKTAGELADALAAKQVSAVELAGDAIGRIESCEERVNAICVRDFSRALDAARAADKALARGDHAPLLGVPMTVKESFNLAGTPTTWGFAPQRNFMPAEDALAVARAKAAGAVMLGKTNVPVALADWQSYNDIYGATNNPFDLARTLGGSSGGSAAALALGYGPLSLGSDIGGSLRVPANFCGVYAHKPTFALAPPRGHTPPGLPALPGLVDLAVIGPMARSAVDLARLLDIIAVPDELENGVGYRVAVPAARHESLKDYRVLALAEHPLVPTEECVRAAIGDLTARLAKSGATVAEDSALLPDLANGARLYTRLLMATMAANWPPQVYAAMQDAAAALKDDDVSVSAEFARGAVLSHRDWVAADRRRNALRAQWRALFGAFDAVICPITPTPAFPHDHSPNQQARRILINGEPQPYLAQLLWPGVATAPGLPATAIPIGRSPEGLPIGAQIIGPWLEDRTTLKLAELIEREFGGFAAPAGFED